MYDGNYNVTSLIAVRNNNRIRPRVFEDCRGPHTIITHRMICVSYDGIIICIVYRMRCHENCSMIVLIDDTSACFGSGSFVVCCSLVRCS